MWVQLGQLLSGLLPGLLDWVGSKFASFGKWVGRKYESKAKKNKSQAEVKAQLKRHIKALKESYDGETITKEQKQELDDSLYELLRDY